MTRRPLATAGSIVALVLAVVMAVVLVANLGQVAGQRMSNKPKAAPAAVAVVPLASPSPSASPSPRPTPSPVPSPVVATQLFVYIFGSDYGDVAASTMPGAACSASVTMPDGKRTELGARTANEQGTVAWSYPPRSPAAQGSAYHTVTCRLGGQSATGDLNFEVGG
jgi:hypothetical protein